MTDRRKEKRNNKWRDIAASLCFLSPSLLGVGVFFILPFGVVVYYSMIDGVGTRNFVFLDNFTKLLSNSAFLMAARNTLLFSALAVPLAARLTAATCEFIVECPLMVESMYDLYIAPTEMVSVIR